MGTDGSKITGTLPLFIPTCDLGPRFQLECLISLRDGPVKPENPARAGWEDAEIRGGLRCWKKRKPEGNDEERF